jgi:hypothetical protein
VNIVHILFSSQQQCLRGCHLDRPVADRSPINHARSAGPLRPNGPQHFYGDRRPIPPLPLDGGSDAKTHDLDGGSACARSVGCYGHRADSITRRGTPARANSKRHADRQGRRLPRLWTVLSAGHDPALRTLPPLLVRPLLLTLGAVPELKARLDVLLLGSDARGMLMKTLLCLLGALIVTTAIGRPLMRRTIHGAPITAAGRSAVRQIAASPLFSNAWTR